MTLPELLEGLVRYSLYRQADHNKPSKPVPDALVAMIEQHIQPAYAKWVAARQWEDRGLWPRDTAL